ncbi:uncharacterized protein ACB058_003680 isoform 1-T2 [Synchiropus picturatus]
MLEMKQHQYSTEKMIMRQFMLLRQQGHVSDYVSVEDMKSWLLASTSFQEEFDKTVELETKDFHPDEEVLTSGKRQCLDQIELELQEELEKENILSDLYKRKVTLEGHALFLSTVRPKTEHDVKTGFKNLSKSLLDFFTGSHIDSIHYLRLIFDSLVSEVVEKVLNHLLDKFAPMPSVDPSQSQSLYVDAETRLHFSVENRVEAASVEIGKLLSDKLAYSFDLVTDSNKTEMEKICTSAAVSMVQQTHKNIENLSQTYDLMDFDESFFIAREGVISAIQDMEECALREAYNSFLNDSDSGMTDDPGDYESVATAMTDSLKDKKSGKVGKFFRRVWKKLKQKPTDDT